MLRPICFGRCIRVRRYADTPTESSKMTFRDVGAERQMSVFEDKITPYRFEDMVLVVIKDSAICGQKATKASFAIKGNEIALDTVGFSKAIRIVSSEPNLSVAA
jgi:hypothetical protein